MTKVQCIECGNIQGTYARWFYICNKCEKKQLVENSTISETKSNSNSQQGLPTPEGKATSEAHTKLSVPVVSQKLNMDSVIEIEEQEPDSTEPEIDYRCPNCNSLVTKFEDCTNSECFAEISWKE